MDRSRWLTMLTELGWQTRLFPPQQLSLAQAMANNRFGLLHDGDGFSFARFEDEVIHAALGETELVIFGDGPSMLFGIAESGHVMGISLDDENDGELLTISPSLASFVADWSLIRAALYLHRRAQALGVDEPPVAALSLLRDHGGERFDEEADGYWGHLAYLVGDDYFTLARKPQDYIETGQICGFG